MKFFSKYILPYVLSWIIPGLGHLYAGKYRRGALILFVWLITCFFLLFIVSYYVHILLAIWSMADLYHQSVKSEGRDKAIKHLIFASLTILVIIPAFALLFYTSIFKGATFVSKHYLNQGRTKKEMTKISMALEHYKKYKHRYPESFKAFVTSKPIWSNWNTDAWGEPYLYEQTDSLDYSLTSAGKDGIFDTADDLNLKSQ